MPVASTRITLNFSLLGGVEVASTSFATPPVGSPTQAALTSLAQGVSALFSGGAWFAQKAFYPTTTAFTGADARSYDSSNTLIASGSSVLTTPVPGTSSIVGLPVQTAIVVSLLTPNPGARGRGRMYLPGPTAGEITTVGRVSTALRNAIADSMQTFFEDFNALPDAGPVSVASQVGGFVTAVNSLRVGDVFDTQRRRRDDLPESYTVRPVN